MNSLRSSSSQSEKNIYYLKRNLLKNDIFNSYDKFLEIYNKNVDCFRDIFYYCKKGILPQEYRIFTWQFFLNIFPYNKPKEWKNILDEYRSNYYNNKSKFINNKIHNFIICNDEKGNENYENLKKELLKQDYEILSLIKLDIIRTYQEIELFHNDTIKEILCNVLYIFSKINPNPGYFQGMSDICAVFLYVLYRDYTINSDFIKNDVGFLFYILYSDNHFIEADLYSLFSRLMSKDLYLFFNYNKKKSFLSDKNLSEKLELTQNDIISCNDNILKKRVFNIFYIELKKLDEKLSKILIKEEELDYFLSRWYLCLFSREFSIEKTIKLWDIIFCYEFLQFHFNIENNEKNKSKNHFNFLDYIALSMFYNVKNRMKKVDEEKHNLHVMTHYPEGLNVIRIIYDAVSISKKFNGNILNVK